MTRRAAMRAGAMGLAAIGSGGLVLRADAEPTPAQGDPDHVQRVLSLFGEPPQAVVAETPLVAGVERGYGPFHLPRAPFRGKVSPIGAPGTPLVVQGRVWSHDSRRALPGAILDVFQVDEHAKYSQENEGWRYRARLLTNETGYYELETVHPIPYEVPVGSGNWRSAHVHVIVVCPGFRTLATELLFEGDPKADDDFLGRPASLVHKPEFFEVGGVRCERVWFDLVLQKA